jgi:hypothetical protein
VVETGDLIEDPVIPEDIQASDNEAEVVEDEEEEEIVQEPEEPEEPEEGEYVSGESEKERIPTPLPPPRKTPSPKKKKRKSTKSRRSSYSSKSSSSPPKSRRWQSVPEKSPETTSPLLKTLPIKRGNSPVEFIKSFDKPPLQEKELSSSSGDEDVARSSPLIRPVLVPMKIVMPTSLPVQGPQTKPQDYLEEINSDSQTNLSNISEAENDNEKEKSGGEEEESSDEDKSKKPKTTREDSSPPPVTWYERWFQSKSMQKVVKTNKIQKKLRKKLKKNVEEAKPPKDLSKDDAGLPVIGSIEEYEKLFGKKIQTPQGPVPAPVDIPEEEENKEVEDEDENEEEADLWGDIIGDD